MHLKRNYDTIALFYDRLARLVYGEALIEAQVSHLKAIPARAHILIVGGGTGRILEEIAKVYSSGLCITYIDASAKMIALAKSRDTAGNKVTFIASRIEAIEAYALYDVVITPFVLDNFTDEQLPQIGASIDKQLKTNGTWLYCDFQNTNVFWQQALLKIMYFFFRLTCGIEASRLPAADAWFAQNGYQLKEQITFMNGFVASCIYEKKG